MLAVDAAWSAFPALSQRMPLHPQQWLSPAEHRQYASLRAEGRRNQFLAGRWLARELLAAAHGAAPRDWRLSDSRDAAPVVVDGPACKGWRIGLTHSADQIACAVADAAVGIDLEVPKPGRDLQALAQWLCGDAENRWLQSLPAGERAAGFYELWSVKEAWIKREGAGVFATTLAALTALRSATRAEVSTWRKPGSGACTLALTAGGLAEVRWHGDAPVCAGHWSVRTSAPVRPAA